MGIFRKSETSAFGVGDILFLFNGWEEKGGG